ncbi:hypothetical protein H4Q32_027860 [Labeo rohita]|nr:hypothetical protein H4Q32_027860 [Labeo rohita]
MADCKEIVGTNVSSPEFIQELFPAAERTALLYHMSYLCLGGFPNLERLLRQRAIETQMLFGSSEALLMKCTGTSENLVKSLLPFLKVAVEKNNPELARNFLEKAKGWIEDIINDVKEIVTSDLHQKTYRYEWCCYQYFTSLSGFTGLMPSVTHLGEVQKCLSRIQHILLQLQKFWEKVGTQMDMLKKRTVAGEDCINYLEEMKEEFLESIKEAKEEWKKFGISCMKANQIFSVQSSQAYKFLEVSPSSLSKEEWQKEYESVKQKLEKIRPYTVSQNAITQ